MYHMLSFITKVTLPVFMSEDREGKEEFLWVCELEHTECEVTLLVINIR